MNFKYIKLLFFFILITNCTTQTITNNKINSIGKKNFVNKGFTLIYSDDLYENKIINNKLDSRGLLIFQKNLKEGTSVRITNILNKKSIVAKVGPKAKYPLFNNSVISNKIANEIQIDFKEPYVEIFEILYHESFIIKKTKTFDEEKNVADKAPIDKISINNLAVKKNKKKIKKDSLFRYTIKIGDFYFKDTAKSMLNRVKDETPIKNVSITNLSNTQYRVFIGPFFDIILLQKAFNGIKILEFENIEIIKHD